MNNDLNKNVLQQYVDEIQSMTKEIENNLLKIQNDQIKLFKNNLNNISNNCISDVQLLLNKTNSKVKNNLHNNTIDNELINDFQFQVQAILLQAKNDLDTYKNSFDLSVMDKIDTETIKLKKFISENHGKIEEELHEALYQINQSENSALNRLEETYDLGVETIVSAERTALKNLKILSEELSLKLESKVEEIENVIHEKLQNALDNIKKVEENALANITQLEITIKQSLQNEKDGIISEMQNFINNFEFSLQGYVNEMKTELTVYKDQLLEEIIINKEEIFIEIDKVKNNIIEELREKEYIIIQNLNNVEQEIITELIAVVQGFDLELETIKTSKIQEFTQGLVLLKEQCLNEIISVVNDCLNQLDQTKENIKAELLLEFRNECQKQLIIINNELNNLYNIISSNLGTNENEGQWKTINDGLKATKAELTTSLKNDAKNITSTVIEDSKKKVNEYFDYYMKNNEGNVLKYNVTLIKNQKEIIIPDSYLVHAPKITIIVHVDGIQLIENKHYSIDFTTKRIIFASSFIINQLSDAEITFLDLKGFKGIQGQYVFQIENGDLIVYVDEQVTSPSFSINENGELEIEIM